MFRAGLLLIIRRYYSIYTRTSNGVYHALCWLAVGRTYTNRCVYRL